MTAEVFSITADRPNQETLPLMAVARESDVKNVGMREQNLLSLSYGEIVRKDINSADGLLPASFETYQIVEPGMTVLRFTDLQNDQRSLRSGLVTERGIITSAYVAVDPFAMNPQFFAYLMRAYDTNKVFYGMGGGVRQGLNFESIRRLPVPLLPADEQRAIADYLDQETARIDALVAKQEEFIGLLRERRSGVIFQAVTRGLRAGIDLKPSPLSWVAEVPASWRVLNIRRVAEMKTGHTPSRTTSEYWEHTTIPWFTLADVWQLRDGTRTYLGETKSLISPLGLRKSAAELLPAGTVVLSRTASVGLSGIMPRPMATSQDFWNWVCGPGLIPEYLLHVFRAMRSEFNLLMIGSTHKTIYQPTAAAIRIPVPPVEEQREIVSYLGDQLPHLDTLITKAEEHIALAKERRSALITAAVTGQFDVRTARKAG